MPSLYVYDQRVHGEVACKTYQPKGRESLCEFRILPPHGNRSDIIVHDILVQQSRRIHSCVSAMSCRRVRTVAADQIDGASRLLPRRAPPFQEYTFVVQPRIRLDPLIIGSLRSFMRVEVPDDSDADRLSSAWRSGSSGTHLARQLPGLRFGKVRHREASSDAALLLVISLLGWLAENGRLGVRERNILGRRGRFGLVALLRQNIPVLEIIPFASPDGDIPGSIATEQSGRVSALSGRSDDSLRGRTGARSPRSDHTPEI